MNHYRITSVRISSFRRFVVVVAAALMFVFGSNGQLAFAQLPASDDRRTPSSTTTTATSAQAERELTGMIRGLGATTVTIDDTTVTIAGAEVQGALALGAQVSVHVRVAADGSLIAREIMVLAPAAAATPDDSATATPVADDHGHDGAAHDANDDHGQDGAAHDANDDHGQDGADHDANDDHGQDNATAPADDHSKHDGGKHDGGKHDGGKHK